MKNLAFSKSLPQFKNSDDCVVIYDKVLPKVSKSFAKWLKGFEKTYAVVAGEELKDIPQFPAHIQKITKICENTSVSKMQIIVVGGGSVGDFGGFVASILKRGVALIHIPSTWLAAIDSAHGGKTALNVGEAKNQIGTFYPAQKIHIVEELLRAQPEARAFDGFGELMKIALLEGGSLWKKLSKEKNVDSQLLWKYLKPAIQAKYAIVNKDPLEKKGIRHLLNLGHTVGHVLEKIYALPHGVAINYGIDFSLRWSLEKKLLSQKEYDSLMQSPVMVYLLSPLRDDLFKTSESFLKKVRQGLLNDKKKDSQSTVRFIFLKKPGHCVPLSVSVDDILIEICRQIEEEKLG